VLSSSEPSLLGHSSCGCGNYVVKRPFKLKDGSTEWFLLCALHKDQHPFNVPETFAGKDEDP